MYSKTHLVPTAERVRVSISVPLSVYSLEDISNHPILHPHNQQHPRTPMIEFRINSGGFWNLGGDKDKNCCTFVDGIFEVYPNKIIERYRMV